MIIKCGDGQVEIRELAQGIDGEYRACAEIHTDRLLTADEMGELTGNDWLMADGRVISGMDTVTGCVYRFATLTSQTPRETELEKENSQLKQTAEAANAEIENLLQAARDGLLSPPVPGEAWDADKWYRAGDTVTWPDKQMHRCLKTCKNKAPDAAADYWEVANVSG